jgi:hypothetical protein
MNATRVGRFKHCATAPQEKPMKTPFTTVLLASIVFTSAALAAEVDNREANQQARIAQGVKSGQLTPGETAHLDNREAHINNEIARDRAANGGHLTGAERAKVNRQQDRTSAAIYRDKHNGKVR